MNRIKLIAGMFLVLTAMPLSWGVGLTYAAPADPPAADNQATAKKAAADKRALERRAADMKRRQEARKRVLDTIGAKQPGTAAAPDSAGQGGAK